MANPDSNPPPAATSSPVDPTRGPNHSRRFSRRWLLAGAGVLVLLLIGSLIVKSLVRPDVEKEIDLILSDVRREERNEKPLFQALDNLRSWPEPLPKVADLILGDYPETWDAESKLAELGSMAIPPLMRLVARDGSPAVRVVAVEALASMQAREAVSVLTNALIRDRSLQVRVAVASAFSYELEDVRAVPALIHALKNDPESSVRSQAASALGYLGDSRAAKALLASLNGDAEGNVRASSASALGQLGDTNALPELRQTLLTDKDASARGSAGDAIATLAGDEAAAELASAFASERDTQARRMLVMALIGLEAPEARETLKTALKEDPEHEVRSTVARYFGYHEARWALPLLVAALERDPHSEVRSAAAGALGAMGGPDIAQALMQALRNDSDSSVQREAVEGLGNSAAKEAVPLLATIVKSTAVTSSVRQQAAEALGTLSYMEAVPDLLAFVAEAPDEGPSALDSEDAEEDPTASTFDSGRWGYESDNDSPADEAVLAIKTIFEQSRPAFSFNKGDATEWQAAADRATPVLLEVLNSRKDRTVRAAAAEALGAIGDKAIALELIAHLEQDDAPQVRRSAALALGQLRQTNAIPALIAALAGDELLAVSAAEALGLLESLEAAPALLKRLDSESEDMRRAAVEALAAMQATEAIPQLTQLLKEDRDEYVRQACAEALGFMGDERVVPALQAALRDRSSEVREEVAWALGHIGSTNALPALIQALSDRESRVRFIASFALAEIGDPMAVGPLQERLSDRDQMVRLGSASSLTFFDNAQGMEILEEALNSKALWQRFTAIMALARLGTAEAHTTLSESKMDRSTELGQLAERVIHTRGPAAFHECLCSHDRDIRLYAVSALVLFNDPSSRELLEAGRSDSDREIRTKAKLGYQRIMNAEHASGSAR